VNPKGLSTNAWFEYSKDPLWPRTLQLPHHKGWDPGRRTTRSPKPFRDWIPGRPIISV
jgi:hypothetical protein